MYGKREYNAVSCPLESLNERIEKLVLDYLQSNSLTEVHRRVIADRFAKKSLQELHEIVGQLDDSSSHPL